VLGVRVAVTPAGRPLNASVTAAGMLVAGLVGPTVNEYVPEVPGLSLRVPFCVLKLKSAPGSEKVAGVLTPATLAVTVKAPSVFGTA
jgi:hypothetical protein